MRHITLSFALFFSLALQGYSQNSIKKEKIKALFALMHQDSLMIKTYKGMAASFYDMTQMTGDTSSKEMRQKIMDMSFQKATTIALRFLNEDMVDIYDKYFTIEEIEDFVNFYKSKSGQKMCGQMPEITKDIMTVMATKYQAEFQQSFKKEIEEMTKEKSH